MTLRYFVEVAGADLALMPRRGVAMRLARELLRLKLGVGGHAARFEVVRQREEASG